MNAKELRQAAESLSNDAARYFEEYLAEDHDDAVSFALFERIDLVTDHILATVRDEPIDKKTRQRIEDLERCIEKLEGNQRVIIREDLASEDIADGARLAKMLGTTTNSIYVSRIKARANLKKCVENETQRRSKGAKP